MGLVGVFQRKWRETGQDKEKEVANKQCMKITRQNKL